MPENYKEKQCEVKTCFIDDSDHLLALFRDMHCYSNVFNIAHSYFLHLYAKIIRNRQNTCLKPKYDAQF